MKPRNSSSAHLNRLLAPVLLLALAVACPVANAATGQQRKIVEEYLEAAGDGDKQGVVLNFFHGGDVEQFRTRVVAALDAEKAQGGSAMRNRLFGSAASLEELRRLTPPNLLLAITRRIALPGGRVKEVQLIEIVEEDGNTQHAVVRVWPEKKRQGPGRVRLVTLRKLMDRSWRIGIPDEWVAKVDAAISGGADAPAAEPAPGDAPAATNSPEILQLIDSSTRMLRDGNCTSYYTIYVSPKFRAGKSDKALKTLIQQCERSIDMREMYASALNVARQSAPAMAGDGLRAVYDLKGQGLPFESFTLEKVGDRWFIAE